MYRYIVIGSPIRLTFKKQKHTIKIPMKEFEQRPTDLVTAANGWLYKVEEERWRTSSNYEEGLDLLCQLVNQPDYETVRQALEKVRKSKEIQEVYFKGREVKAEFKKPPGKINSALLKIDPHLCGDPSFLRRIFREPGLKWTILHRLKALRNVGLNEESHEYPYLLALLVATSAREKMFEPLIKKISAWAKLSAQGGTVELGDSQLVFTSLLKESEYCRGFSDQAIENLDQYADKIFGEEAEEAKSLWPMLWFVKTSELKGKVKITPLIERMGKLLMARNWDESEDVLTELASKYPEIFKITDLRQLGLEPKRLVSFAEQTRQARRKKEKLRAKRRKEMKMVLEYARSNPSTKGETRDEKTIILKGVGKKELYDERTSLYLPGKKECIIIEIEYESKKPAFLRHGKFRTIYLSSETFLKRLRSGEYIFSDLNIDSAGDLFITTERSDRLQGLRW